MATTIVVSPLGRQSEATGEVIKLHIVITSPADLIDYNRLEVWRSTVGQGGPYEELTASQLLPARVPKGALNPPAVAVAGPNVMLNGKSLELLVQRGEQVTIMFAGVDPLTYGAAAAQIIAQGRGLVTAYVTSTGKLVVQTTAIGPSASLRVLATDGAALLGLPYNLPSQGRDAWMNLFADQTEYQYEDLYGSSGYYYKIRLRNDGTDAVNEFSAPHSIATRVGVSTAQLITGVAQLVQADGRPLTNQEVHVHMDFTGMLVEGAVVAGTDRSQLTDINGNVQFTLVRGQRMTVSVPGTSLYRSITVPTDPLKQTFGLFDPDVSNGNDVFRVQVPNIVIAERRSM